jgi:hypothetical protein
MRSDQVKIQYKGYGNNRKDMSHTWKEQEIDANFSLETSKEENTNVLWEPII